MGTPAAKRIAAEKGRIHPISIFLSPDAYTRLMEIQVREVARTGKRPSQEDIINQLILENALREQR